jgi:uncharacterized membrane protein YgcG
MRKLALLAGLALMSAGAYANELHWNAFDVDARLDRDGRLHVIERQTTVFTGDWNGGERIFNIRFGQVLDFETMVRIDESGRTIEMNAGSTEDVDDYDFTERHTLRWRSRLPSDAPFENRSLTYELHYSLGYVLVPRGDAYLLDHDFAFPARDGNIENFTVRLAIDPMWRMKSGTSPLQYHESVLEPGRGYVVTVPFEYAGAGTPASVRFPQPAAIRNSGIAAIAAGLLALLIAFLVGETRIGRFARINENVDEEWLNKHLFFAQPEVVGALWDRETGASEVAAILAKLTQQKKITTNVIPGGWFRSPEMEMTWTGNREELELHERDLVDALFLHSDATSTSKIREHYKSSGFNPANEIRGPIEKLIARNKEWKDRKRTRIWPVLLVAMLASYALLPFAALHGGYDLSGALVVGCSGLFIAIFGALIAHSASHAVARIPRNVIGLSIPTLIQAAIAIWFIARADLFIGPFSIFAYCAVVITTYAFSLSFARIADSPERMAVRKRLLLARDHFRRELASRAPQLRDDWMPYIIAFGLGASVDRWVKRFGVASRSSSGWGASTGSSGSFGSSGSATGSSGTHGFSGGGGAFGGAGATGTWAVAAGAIASGVAAPSSSGSGGGGSSGGGGGGGW